MAESIPWFELSTHHSHIWHDGLDRPPAYGLV